MQLVYIMDYIHGAEITLTKVTQIQLYPEGLQEDQEGAFQRYEILHLQWAQVVSS